MFPTIAQYNQAIQAKGGHAFKTLSNLTFIPSRTLPVRIYSYGAGSYAVVFKAKDFNGEYAIRCFISAEQENIDRYKKIDSYLRNLDASWITRFEFLDAEINVENQYFPVIKMDWVEGLLLNNFITNFIDDNSVLTELQCEIIEVSRSLESLKIGHGDIQCGNIIVVRNSEGKLRIKLIDYDGMYIPTFSNKLNLERGRTEFQHPNRSEIHFGETIDRFSFWVILCAIEAIKYDKTLWFEVMRGGFNTLDNLLFSGNDLKYFNNSKLVNRLYSLDQRPLNFYLNKLNRFCNSAPDDTEPPRLFEMSEQMSEDAIPNLHSSNNSGNIIEIITRPTGAAVLTPTFQRIGTTPLRIDKEEFIGKTLVISYGTQFKQVPIEQDTALIELHFNQFVDPVISENAAFQAIPPDRSQNIGPKSQQTQSQDQSMKSNTGFMISGIGAIIFLGFIIAVYLSKVNEFSNYTSTNTNTYSPNPSATYTAPAPEAYVEPLPAELAVPEVEAAAVQPYVDASAANSIQNQDNSSSVSYKDALDLSAEQAVRVFLAALDQGDWDAAWSKTYNPKWEQNGKLWFCSSAAFGGVTKVEVNEIYPLKQGYIDAEIYVNYYAEDKYNGNKVFQQKFIVKKFSFTKNDSRWMLIKMVNIEAPVILSGCNE